MPVEGKQGRAFAGLRCSHSAYIGSLRNARHLWRYVFPGLSAVAGDLYVAVISADPQHIGGERGFAEGSDGGVFLDAVVPRQRVLVRGLPKNLQLVAVHARGEVSAEPRPSVSAVRGFEEVVAAVINGGVLERGNGNWGIPLEPVVRVAGLGLRLDGALLPGAQVAAVDESILGLGVNNPRFDIIDGRIEAVAAVNHLPVFIDDAVARERLAGAAPASVVLQTATDVIGLLVIEGDFVELSDGNGVEEIPGLAGVVAPVNSAVRTGNHVVRIRGIDPHGVIIAVNAPNALGRESFSAILGVKHLRAERPDSQIVVGIDAHLAVVRGPRIGVAHSLPGLTFIIAAKDSALFVLH